MFTDYLLTQNSDVCTLLSTSGVDINYTLKVSDGCANQIDLLTDSLAPGASLNIDLTKQRDGVYTLYLTDEVEETSIYITKYSKLLLSAISAAKYYLCNDTSCSPAFEINKMGLNALVKFVYLTNLYNPTYNAILGAVFSETKCLISNEAHTLLVDEMLRGFSENTQLNKKLIAHYYLAFYLAEFKDLIDLDAIAATNTKFQINSVFTCISALGIDINSIIQKIKDMATLTITMEPHINLPPSAIESTSLTVANRVEDLVLSIDLFSAGYTDPEGDALYKVRIDTLPSGIAGVLKLNGLNVVAGQEILASDIIAGLLTYTAPNQDIADVDQFTFSVSDTGSQQFTS